MSIHTTIVLAHSLVQWQTDVYEDHHQQFVQEDDNELTHQACVHDVLASTRRRGGGGGVGGGADGGERMV